MMELCRRIHLVMAGSLPHRLSSVVCCIDRIPFRSIPYLNVPAHTEGRINKLVGEALAATTETDVERILPELRSALQEHIRLAKESLETQSIILKE